MKLYYSNRAAAFFFFFFRTLASWQSEGNKYPNDKDTI